MPASLESLSFFVAGLIAVIAPRAAAQNANGSTRPTAAALVAKVDSVVQVHVLAQGVPSASIVVTRGNETLVGRAWGLTDVASGHKAEPASFYQTGSFAKQFTAALLRKLVDRG